MLFYASLIISLLAFVIYKIYFLSVPYFWDESWVYAPAVSEMSQRFPSLLPGSIDIDLSRGHPMLFHFLGGIWGNVFGISISSLHVFALVISGLLLFSSFKVAKGIQNSLSGKLFILLMLGQSIFLAQSAMVLPEIMVSLFGISSIYYWSKEKFIISAVLAASCLLTKESGAVLMPVLGISWLIISILRNKFNWIKAIQILGYLILATLPYILFLIIQKARFDWYLYPNHLDLQSSSLLDLQNKFRAGLEYIFLKESRVVLSLFVLITLIWHHGKSRIFWASILFTAVNLLCIYIWDWKQGITLLLYALFSLLGFFSLLYGIRKQYKPIWNFMIVAGVFLFFFLFFTAWNFFSNRYLLICIVLYTIISASILTKWNKPIIPLIASLLCLTLFTIKGLDRSEVKDINQSYIDYGQAQLQLTKYMENEKLYNQQIFAPFLVREGLIKKNAGFRHTDQEFDAVKWSFNNDKKLYNILSSRSSELISQQNLETRILIKENVFEKGTAKFTIQEYGPKQTIE